MWKPITMNRICIVVLALASVAVAAKYNGPTNQAGINLLKEFEGFRANFYKDPVGIRTIGYGHACHALPCSVPIYGKYKVPLTKASGEAILKEDLKRGGYESCVKNGVSFSGLNANQYSALVSFVYNLGCGAFRSSTLRTKLNKGDVNGAANEFGKWVYAGGKKLPGLVRRRAAERKLFCASGGCSGGGGGGGGGGKTCTGTSTATVRIRSKPSTSSSVVGTIPKGSSSTITGRTTGTNVFGNSNWFKTSKGYVSAYYINISSNNGASYCKKN